MKNVTLKKLVRLAKYGAYYSGISPKPLRIQADLTDHCNFRCPTCSKWKVKTQGEMKTDDWKRVLDKLEGASYSNRITFAGGEPLLRKDVAELVRHAHDLGFHVLLISNGFLMTPEKLTELEEAGLKNLVLSLNGIDARTHDASRGVNGSWERIMALLPLLRERRMKTNLETILLNSNIDQIIPLVRLAEQHSLHGIAFQVLADDRAHYALAADHMEDAPENWYEKDPLWIKDPERIASVIEELIALQKQGAPILNDGFHLEAMIEYYRHPAAVAKTPCLGGIATLYVDPYGRTRICYGFDPVGSVLDEDPVRIWRSREAKQVRACVKKCDKMCRLLNNNY